MKPGRELDALINEKVMGYIPDKIPHYSTDIKAAWEVVEKVKTIGRFTNFTIQYLNEEWLAGTFSYQPYEGGDFDDQSIGESAPHAICLAALKIVEREKK